MNTKNSRKAIVSSDRVPKYNIWIPSEQLPEYMKTWGLADAGFKYDVVAVFGSQSTGKSK